MQYLKRFKNPAFLKFFWLLLLSECVTILITWWLLNFGASLWIQNKLKALAEISKGAQAAADWSRLDEIQEGKANSKIFLHYMAELQKLNKLYFPRNDGELLITKIMHGKEYALVDEDTDPYEPLIRATQWDIRALHGVPSVSSGPYSDEFGTQLSAMTPIFKGGKVFALMEADYDSIPLRSFRNIVKTSFLWAVGPACLISLLLAAILALRYVEPMAFLREIQEIKEHPEQVVTAPKISVGQTVLSKRENEITRLVGQGLKNREIADRLSIGEETVKQHLKNIFQKLGISSRVNLALYALSKTEATREAHPPKG